MSARTTAWRRATIGGALLATVFAAVGTPASAAPAVRAPAPRLVATAIHPGAAGPQTATLSLEDYLADFDVRLVRQPAADTVVLAAPATVHVRRHGRWVMRRAKPCVEVRMRLSLHFDQSDPIKLATLLSPVADMMIFGASSHTVAPVQDDAAPEIELMRVDGRSARRVGAVRTGVEVWAWNRRGLHGLSAVSVRNTVVRTGRGCDPEEAGISGLLIDRPA